MGISRPETLGEAQRPIIVEESVRGIPAPAFLRMLVELGKFVHDEVPDVAFPLWDVVMESDNDGLVIYAVGPDLSDAESEYVVYWHFGRSAWVWEP
jgi:hypothetical protein